jgi:hypothetical protein
MVAENALRTFTVGSGHLVNLSYIIATPQLFGSRDLLSQYVADIVRRTASLRSVKWWIKTEEGSFPVFFL